MTGERIDWFTAWNGAPRRSNAVPFQRSTVNTEGLSLETHARSGCPLRGGTSKAGKVPARGAPIGCQAPSQGSQRKVYVRAAWLNEAYG